uniref:Uncharacterized protein n=1 Tax=Glossina morsitans morsitans TaxID=37546 RepID=A0A1B0FCZ0_GLOMM
MPSSAWEDITASVRDLPTVRTVGKRGRDPLQHACKAYCTARQELAVLLTLKHPNIVPLVGICIKPLALVLELAPLGGLDSILRQYRRSGAHVGPHTFQILVLQRHIIYRDLKSENVLVWDFPQPHAGKVADARTHLKSLANSGICPSLAEEESSQSKLNMATFQDAWKTLKVRTAEVIWGKQAAVPVTTNQVITNCEAVAMSVADVNITQANDLHRNAADNVTVKINQAKALTDEIIEDRGMVQETVMESKRFVADSMLKLPNEDLLQHEVKATAATQAAEIDEDDFLFVSVYATDIYDYLFKLESEQPIEKNHLKGQKEIDATNRSVLVDWINEIHLHFHMNDEVFQLTVAIIDRYLQIVKDTQLSQFQLVGVTAFFLAAKYEESQPPSFMNLLQLTDQSYTDSQLRQMELKILKILDYNLSRPLPVHFLKHFIKIAEAEAIDYAMSKYLIELTMTETDMAHYKPSELAAASLFLALNLTKVKLESFKGFENSYWTPTLQQHSRYGIEDIQPIARKIAKIARNAQTNPLKAVYNKYKSRKLLGISLRSELYGCLIDSFIKDEN